jgi:hypothetical protein
MGSFWDATTDFPALVPGILLVGVVAYWALVLIGALDLDLLGGGDIDLDFDADLDAGFDAGTDIEADVGADGPGGGGAAGPLGTAWAALGLTGVPLTVSLSLLVVFAWFVALVAGGALDEVDASPLLRLAAGTAALVIGAAVGGLAASVAARPLARLFVSTQAERRVAFVGRTCTVRTNTVTGSFGQAEATDPSGATVLVQVRTAEPASLGYGAPALIYDYDPGAEVFLVCPIDDGLVAGGDVPPTP